ncbi:MAG: phosphatase PAP2 family protein, partial [Chloroflexota bacterium]
MDLSPLQEAGLEVTRWFQDNFAALGWLFRWISAVGTFEFYLGIVLLIYWCFDKKRGKQLGMLLAASVVSITIFKHLFRQPRPFWLDEALLLGDAESYGFPSGHVASAAVGFAYLAYWFRDRYGYYLAGLIVLLMMVSRIYLGVHFWYDVIGGLILGGIILSAGYAWIYFAETDFEERILGQRFWFVVVLSASILLLYQILLLGINYFTDQPLFNLLDSDLDLVEKNAWIGSFTGLSVLLGLGCGFALESSWVRFQPTGTFWQRSYRFLIGLLVVLMVLFG